jgi:hypothetical protein
VEDSENTPDKQKPQLWKPGQSGNPAGRPKGARSKFAQSFVEAFAKDFEEHGQAVIEKVRLEDPSTYMRTACTILPKVIELDDDTKEALTSALAAIPFDAIRSRHEDKEQPRKTH